MNEPVCYIVMRNGHIMPPGIHLHHVNAEATAVKEEGEVVPLYAHPAPSAPTQEPTPTLAWLQENLPWTIPYSDEFEASATINPRRRISHDVLHLMKSLGRIAAECEAADHQREGKGIDWPKETSDLVICGLHIARLMGFSLEDAVIDCSGTRNGVDLRKTLKDKSVVAQDAIMAAAREITEHYQSNTVVSRLATGKIASIIRQRLGERQVDK